MKRAFSLRVKGTRFVSSGYLVDVQMQHRTVYAPILILQMRLNNSYSICDCFDWNFVVCSLLGWSAPLILGSLYSCSLESLVFISELSSVHISCLLLPWFLSSRYFTSCLPILGGPCSTASYHCTGTFPSVADLDDFATHCCFAIVR